VEGTKKTEGLPHRLVVIATVLVICMFPTMLDTTIVNIAINSLGDAFGTTLGVTQWVVTGYALTLSLAVPLSVWLFKRIEGKRLVTGSLILFTAGSALSGFAWDMQSLIAFRILQGFAAGIMIPTITSLIVQAAGGKGLGKLMAVISLPVIFAPIVGPVIGGLIIANVSWRWLFFVNVPIEVVGLALVLWKIPRFEATDARARLDLTGILMLAVASVGAIYGITCVKSDSSRIAGIVVLVVALLCLVVYVLHAHKRDGSAVIPLDLFHSRCFSASFVSLFLAGFATNGPMLLLPLLFQNVMGLDVISAALWLVPQGVGMLLTRSLAGRLADRLGARPVTLPAIVVIMLGTLPFAFFDASTSQYAVWAALLVRGMGLGAYVPPVMSDSYVGLERPQIPSATAATRMIQNVGTAFGSAVLSTVVTASLAAGTAVTGSYQAGFVASLVFGVISLIPALFLSDKRKAKPVCDKAR